MAIDLVCLGNVTIDDTVMPDGLTKMACFGGDTIYGALSAALWNENVRVVAPIGEDFPPEHLKKLGDLGWDLAGLPVRPLPTSRSWVIYEYNGDRTWVARSDPDNFFELSPKPEDLPEAYLESKAFLILAMDLKSQEILAKYLHDLGALVCLDTQEDNIVGNQDRVFSMLPNVNIFMPSQTEVHRLLGHDDYKRAAKEFAEYGPEVVVIKMGEQGSLIYQSTIGNFIKVPSFKTKAVDTTGAGDSYCGGFMGMYINNQNLLHAGLAGAVSASFAVEKFGNNRLIEVTQDEANQRFEELLAQTEE